MKWLNKLERKFGRYYISNLMLYIVIGTIVVFAFSYLLPNLPIASYIYFDRDLIFKGQIWRILTFILMPYDSSPIFMLISSYFYYSIGTALENAWGGFRFNVFYFVGVIATIIGGFITGYATCHYLNLSLFLAYAAMFPNQTFLLFFILPIKAKYIAYFDAAFLLLEFITTPSWAYRIAILVAFLNFFLFFGGTFFKKLRDHRKYSKMRKNFKIEMSRRRLDDEDDD